FGLGIVIIALQVLAILGMLTITPVAILMLLGVFAAIRQRRQISFSYLSWHSLLLPEKAALVLFIAAMLHILLAPLCPPKTWDELMYHLPHALHWMETGSLTVNLWLRYPWFPYNYELLYAAALLLYDDVFTHLLHALVGWLCTLLVYQVGLKFATRAQALFAAFIWLVLSAEQYNNAGIDMGTTVFVFGACIAMWLWWKSVQAQFGWLLGAAFLLGVAAGVKYQALSFLPIFTGLMLLRERRIRVISLTVLVFLVPCVYWYARNAIMTGDPFNPLGGPLFGFSDWNAEDYAYQIVDVRSRAEKLPWLLWPALLVPIIPEARRRTDWKLAIGFGGYSILVWY
ncbi:MAG TPA: hypothetical protein VJ508_05245, partial [Saprospiraceae bacterium]|nr:hypothetical protein [Saprospiraceae bacterium]